MGKEYLIMQVDIYDFDKTVVPFDSALKYWGFCMAEVCGAAMEKTWPGRFASRRA